METSRRRFSNWILLYDTMKEASLEENLCCYFFFTILNHDILNLNLGFNNYLNISRNSSTRTLQIQPISASTRLRESRERFLRPGVFVRTRWYTFISTFYSLHSVKIQFRDKFSVSTFQGEFKCHSFKAMQANYWSYFLIFIIIYIYSYLYLCIYTFIPQPPVL